MDGRYGPHLLVNASGTPASPNRIVLKREGLGGLAFPDNTSRADGGSWIQASGPGVARLVVEGNFTTADNSATDALWDMSRIQLQMSGQAPSDAPQALRWCGQDTNAGGTGDLMDLSGFANNYAVRNLILGGDDGATDNYVNFTTVGTSGRSAMYVWGLEFAADAYLNIGPGDYLYYLGTGSSAGGINGMGLTLPVGKGLTDLTSLPDHVIMLGVPEPASAALLLAGGALACHHCRRRPKKNRGK
jgi:hypothetical protein